MIASMYQCVASKATKPSKLIIYKKFIATINRRLGSMGLDKKFYILYVLLLVIPVIALAVVIANNATKSAIDKAMEQGLLDIRATQATVEKNIMICWHAAQLAQSNKKFVEMLSERKQYSTLELVEFQREVLSNIDAIKNINVDLYRYDIYINNEELYEFYPTIHYESRIVDTPWFNELINTSNGLTYQLGQTDNSADDIFVFNSELVSSANEHLGVIRVQMLSSVFFGSLYAMASDSTQFLCIADSNGSLHYNRMNTMASKYMSGDTNFVNELIREAGASKSGFVTMLGNNQVVVNWVYIPTLKYYLMGITSMEPVNRQITAMIITVFTGSFLVLGFLSLATYAVVSVLMRKLRTVIALMRHVEHGDLVVDIPDLGNDEIGELNRHFRNMLGKINELIYTVYKKQIAARDAEIKSLYSQLNAHFIYNVLESIKMMAVLKYEYEIADSITSLGKIMRYSMNWRKQYVLLREEIGSLSSYVRLMNLQREYPVELVFDIPEALYGHEVLKMSLQPLAENAMVHGMKMIKEGGRLDVKAEVDNSYLLISVSDNGCGIPQERLIEINAALEQNGGDGVIEGSGNGIGLANINQRIKLFYGMAYGITARSEYGAGACIILKLPAPDRQIQET